MVFEQVIQILVLAIVVLVFWWTHRSFPPDATAELIRDLQKASKQTETKADDVLVDILSALNDLREKEVIVTIPPGPDENPV